MTTPRQDHEAILRFVTRHLRRIGRRQLEVYVMFWEKGMSYRQIADACGFRTQGGEVNKHRAEVIIQRIRRRARERKAT